MVDKKKPDNKVESKAATAKKQPKKVTDSAAKNQTSAAFVAAKGSGGSVATAKAGASSNADMKAAAKKISDVDQELVGSNSVHAKNSSSDLKSRASKAKQRAQDKILEEAYVSDKPEDPLERLANTFDSSAKRWEMVVYPSLFAFVLLAGYGFFLIYRLTHDISTLSQAVTRMAVIVSDAMPRMTKDLSVMTGSINNMTGNIDGMSTEMSSMSGQMNALTPMSSNIESMTNNIGSMNRSVYGMQRDMHGMNRTVSSGPFGMMNDMMPFSSKTNVPPPMAPPAVWPSHTYAPQRPAYKYPAPRAYQTKPALAAKKQSLKPVKKKTVAVKPAGSKSVSTKSLSTKPAVKKSKATQAATVPGVRPVSLKNSSGNNYK